MRAGFWLRAAVAAGAVLTMAGCGSSSSTSSGSSGGEENKSADQILSDAISAFDSQAAAHLATTTVDDTGTSKVDELLLPDSGRATVTDPSGTVLIVVVTGGKAYGSQGGSPFQELTGDDYTEISRVTLHNTASCVRTERGSLTKGTIGTVNGKRSIAIVDDGKAPGASPGTIYVSLDGPTLPVRVAITGPTTAGGQLKCGHTSADTTKSATIDFDYPSNASPITPPSS